MKGVVTKFRKNGFFEVQFEESVAVVELVGCSVVQIGDEIEGVLEKTGGKDLKNITQNDVLDAFVHEITK